MTRLEALHDAILHDASNNTLRLAYADALDEADVVWVKCPNGCQRLHGLRDKRYKCYISGGPDSKWIVCPQCQGTGEVLDTTHSDHAALIRGMVAGEVPSCAFWAVRSDIGGWRCVGISVDDPCPYPANPPWHDIMRIVLGNVWYSDLASVATFTFRAGFPALVGCPTQWWLDHGPQVVRRYPVEKVTLAGRDVETWATRPGHNANREGQVWWYRQFGAPWHDALPKQLLPQELFDRLTSERDQLPGNAGCNYCWYPTRDAALSDLSHAAIQWAWEAITTPTEAHT